MSINEDTARRDIRAMRIERYLAPDMAIGERYSLDKANESSLHKRVFVNCETSIGDADVFHTKAITPLVERVFFWTESKDPKQL